MKRRKSLLAFTALLLLGASGALADSRLTLDFSKASGDPEDWFQKQGWEFKEDIDSMNPRFENGRFVVEPTDDDLGLVIRQFDEGAYLEGVQRLRIRWGVEQYPDGADWSGPRDQTRNTREPISLMVFFGDEKVDSGNSFVPDLPYFMSFFLGEKERPDQAYVANYWQKGGRYFCIPCDGSLNTTFVTEVELPQLFQQEFGKAMPPISGLTIEIDVQKTNEKNGRHAKAYIESIELLDQ